MSAIILEKIQTRPFADSDSTCYIRAIISCDTAADLPVPTYFTGYTLEQASEAHVIADNSKYQMQSDGTWIQQIPPELAFTYTKSEIDDIAQGLSDDIGDVAGDLTTEETARQTADTKLQTALQRQIDTGGKNQCPVNAGSNTLPTRWLQISVQLQPGTYKVYFGSLSSTDTDAATCQVIGFDAGNALATNYIYPERGSDVAADLTVTAETSYVRIYPSDSYAHSDGDTVTVSDLMICTKNDYEISPEYVPYCPTLAELYALVKSYHP